MNLTDEVHYGRGREEGGAIADVVNHHEAVGPVDLLIESGLPFTRLQKKKHPLNKTLLMGFVRTIGFSTGPPRDR